MPAKKPRATPAIDSAPEPASRTPSNTSWQGAFSQALQAINPPPGARRRYLFVPYDQLTDQVGPLAHETPATLGIVLVEAPAKANTRPYHKQKLALVLTNLRHFALEQAARGIHVRYVVAAASYAGALRPLAKELGGLRMMVAAERELREDLAEIICEGLIETVAHEGWVTSREDFLASQKAQPPWRMDAFYKHVRQRTGLLMTDGKPEGGKYSFDADNRKRWTGVPVAPSPLIYTPDAVTLEVCALVNTHYAHHPGILHPERLPASQADAEALWAFAKRECLPHFGPFEDAMSVHSTRLFHSCISPVLNLLRLLPQTVIEEVAAMPVPLASREGFVRQILGWREFVRHVHCETDGFHMPNIPTLEAPGDGGYARWAGKPWRNASDSGPTTINPTGGAAPSHLGAANPLPPAYWGKRSGLTCLDTVIKSVWDEAHSHHITRLMVLSNLATLLDVSPRELTDWFWVAYQDAYDWVVEPNVLGMGTFALGELMSTKPYISGAGYIDKMSDYCRGCAFDPKSNCPITHLYWAFLQRHQAPLAGNPRMLVPLAALKKRSAEKKDEDARIFSETLATLQAGAALIAH